MTNVLQCIERLDSRIVGHKRLKLGYFIHKHCEFLHNFNFSFQDAVTFKTGSFNSFSKRLGANSTPPFKFRNYFFKFHFLFYNLQYYFHCPIKLSILLNLFIVFNSHLLYSIIFIAKNFAFNSSIYAAFTHYLTACNTLIYNHLYMRCIIL